jgi:hypothetical protein
MMVTIYLGNATVGKVLNKDVATSILCEAEMLRNNSNLILVAENRDNKYYLVKETNTVIMHVEDDFCILTDYKVNGKNLVDMMLKEHYAVYQVYGRDWVKNSATSQLVGYDIKLALYGKGCRPDGMTLDHRDATFDEREKVKQFSANNVNDGSHRVRVIIYSPDGLDQFIDLIVRNEQKPGGLYF